MLNTINFAYVPQIRQNSIRKAASPAFRGSIADETAFRWREQADTAKNLKTQSSFEAAEKCYRDVFDDNAIIHNKLNAAAITHFSRAGHGLVDLYRQQANDSVNEKLVDAAIVAKQLGMRLEAAKENNPELKNLINKNVQIAHNVEAGFKERISASRNERVQEYYDQRLEEVEAKG